MTKTDEWYTPLEIIQPIRQFYNFKIDYDPASCIKANQTIKAKNFSSIDDDDSPSKWIGNVWCNPPYCNNAVREWISKANYRYRTIEDLTSIIMLVNRSDAKWYYQFLDDHTGGYYQFRNRIKFIDGETGKKSSPRYNNDLIYWGNNSLDFSNMCLTAFGKPTPQSFCN